MKSSNTYCAYVFLFLLCFSSVLYLRADLDGTSSPVYQTSHYVFDDEEFATGFVSLQEGFTIMPAEVAILNIIYPVTGSIDLRGSGIISLEGDLYLGTNLTFSRSGKISGNGNTVFLDDNFLLPADLVLSFTTDTVIDGQGHDLQIGSWSQLFIETNVTLTLRNLKIKNVSNTTGDPFVELEDGSSKLALDNVIMCPKDDFYFIEGQLFIHNDVVFTGTNRFVYQSEESSYITSQATWYFEPRTTFQYEGATVSSNNLIVMEDENANFYFDQCTVYITHTGLRLTKGSVFFENFVSINTGDFAPPFENGLIFGNSANGVEDDLSIYVLAGSQVDIQGTVFYDNAV